jgi:hypothetical protein
MDVNAAAPRHGMITGGTWCVDRNRLSDFWPTEEMLAEIVGGARWGRIRLQSRD